MILKGYIFSRPFFGERVPQNVQNIVLRDYCKKKNIEFLLSATEYAEKKSSLILTELYENFDRYDGIIMYSLLQLPINKEFRHIFFKKTIAKKKQLHFALENIVAKEKKDFDNLEKFFLIKTAYEKNNQVKSKKQNFISQNHKKTNRNHLERMMNSKVKCMKVSKKYDYHYWDGDRKFGYGGFKYINGYNSNLVKKLIKTYKLSNKSKILDIGCGKGFLLYDIKKILPKSEVVGIDLSRYAKKKAIKDIKNKIMIKDARKNLKFKDKTFDLVLSINTLHNFKIPEIFNCLSEIERVGRQKFVCVESFRNEKEQFNLQCWALTAETLVDTTSWKWLMAKSGYTGDYEFIFF